MDLTDIQLARIDEFSKNNPISKLEKLTLQNFVVSCEYPDYDDYVNFTEIDIRDLGKRSQEYMRLAFLYMYNTTEEKLQNIEVECYNSHIVSQKY
jgi:hypothetical protein